MRPTSTGRAGARPRWLAATVLPTLLVGVLAPRTAAQAAPSPTGEFNYAEALQDSMLFYESQRSGRLPADNRVTWRGDSDLRDGADHGVDLVGGYHDAGDEIKFGLPMAYSMTVLAWGGIDNSAAYAGSGQLPFLLRNVRWGTDYLLKAHTAPHVLYGQVGDASDHNFWGPPEVNPSPRPSFAITESCPGSDLAGESAAALASSSILFRASDPTYSATLLSHARTLYDFADRFRGNYDRCIPAGGFYTSFSGFWDELVWGAVWLYRATGETAYLTKAEQYYPNMGRTQAGVPESNWTMAWDDKAFGAYVLLAKLTGRQQYVDDANRFLDFWTTGTGGQQVAYSPGGEAFLDHWGSLRYAANTAFLALQYSDWTTDAARGRTYHDFAVRQINYILGDNPNHESYLVGFTNSGTNSRWPQFPHSRAAHGSWDQNMADPPATRHLDFGLLVGGPGSAGDGFTDDRNNFAETEGALDYNAAFSGALARVYGEYGGTPRANFPPRETPDGPEMFVSAALNNSGPNFFEIKALVFDKSGWPARALTHGSLRYYFTLDAGVTPEQLAFSSPFTQCTPPNRATQFSGRVYFVTVSCEGQNIAPAGQSQFRREAQFRVIFPVPHDFTKDWSFQGVAPQGATPVQVDDIVLFDGTTPIWGSQPS